MMAEQDSNNLRPLEKQSAHIINQNYFWVGDSALRLFVSECKTRIFGVSENDVINVSVSSRVYFTQVT
jgi:hypothetical protein